MKPDKVFILLLVILLPLTGCIDVSDNADAQDSSDSEESETTVINNYYNNTTTVVQPVEPQLQHLFVEADTQFFATVNITENQVIEWVNSRSMQDFDEDGVWEATNAAQVIAITCIDDGVATEYGPSGYITAKFDFRGEGACSYHLGTNYGESSFNGMHHSILYKVHEL